MKNKIDGRIKKWRIFLMKTNFAIKSNIRGKKGSAESFQKHFWMENNRKKIIVAFFFF